MEVDVAAYQSIPEFTILKATSSIIIGWVPNEDILDEVLEVHSIETLSQFVSWHDDKTRPRAGRIFWTHKDVPEITCPFTLDRHIIRQCSYGKAHKRENKIKKVIDVHDYAQKRTSIQPTRKVDCQAKIIIRYVTIFPQFSCTGSKINDRERRKLIDTLKEEKERSEEKRIYLTLPLKDQHSNHEIIIESAFSKRVHKTIIDKIHELVTSGITNIPLIKKSLKIFVQTEFSKEEVRPSPFDRSYYPLSKDIKNHVQKALFLNRLGGLDQENLQKKIEEWQRDDEERLFLYRPATTSAEKEEKFLLVHQENWQRKILSLYGNTISLLDATYKTTKYALPFFMLVVKTNVDYLPVAQFVVEDEVSSTIEEALSVIKNWNPSWNPGYFMVDYCEAEINAIESVFPTTNVLQCAFHREQAWELKSKGDYKFIKDDFLEKMRHIAYAATEEEYHVALEDLTSNNWYAENKQLQTYVKNRWLNIKERWCRAFQDLGFHSMVTTTNGVETLNKSLKHSYLKLSGTGSLCNLFEIIMRDFLHDLFHTYAMLNIRSSCNFKAYDSRIPPFLHNRPRHIVDHCMKRMISSEMFSIEDLSINEEGVYMIKSRDKMHQVTLGTDDTFPFCDCEDFRKNYLPCKHFFAVFRLANKEWHNISPLYRESPYLSIDKNVLESYSRTSEYKEKDISTPTLDKTEDQHTSILQSSQSPALKDLRYHQQELLSEIKNIRNMVYEVVNTEVLKRAMGIIVEVKEVLRNGMRIEDGLPVRSEQLRTLPKKRRAFASQWKKRVGQKASALKKNICTGLPNSGLKNIDTEVNEKAKENRKHGTRKARKYQKKTVSTLPERDNNIENIKNGKRKVEVLQKKTKSPLAESDNNIASNLVEILWRLERDFDVPVAKIDGSVITDTDIRSLQENQWLTDKVLDSYLTILSTAQNDLGRNIIHYCQTTMTGIINRQFNVNDVRKQKHRLENSELVIGIYHRSAHWTLIVADMRKGTLFFYNPAVEQALEMKKILNSWKTYIDQYVKRFEENVLLDWNIQTVPHSMQKDSYNCGIYCLIFAEKHLQNDFESMKRLSFNDLREMRKKVAQQLMLYEVFLTGCCPKCGFELGEEQGIECCKCRRTYHFKPFCVERDLEDSSTYFTCRLCQINFWDNEHGIQEKCIPKVPRDGLTTIELEENGDCSTQEVISNQEFDELPVPQQCLSHKDLHEQECFSTYSSKEESKEAKYFLRKSPKKKQKRASFFYPDIRPKKIHLEGEMAEHADEEVSSDVLGYKYDEQRFSDVGDSLPAEVVDLYLSLKCKQWKEKNVHFLASEIVTSIFCSVCDPVHKYLSSIDIQNYDILIGALHEGGCHWTLVAIFPNESKVLYVDPHGESEQTKNLYRKQWLNFMTERYNQSIGPYLGENWSVVSIDHQKQSDSHSSGVFILKFADIILSRNGNLDIYFEKVFKDNNGIKAFRMEIGQYLVKCSVDKIQHISESHEESDRKMYDMLGRVCIIPDDEAKENDKDDALSECLLRKEINPDMFPNSLPDIIYEDMKDYLYGIIECESTQCKIESHKRHHKFLQSPLQVCNVERACFGFGCEVIHEETIKYLEVKMNIDLVHYPVDPSKPLRVKKGTIRNVQNKKLSKIFSLYWLVEIYVTGVLLKEAVIYVHMKNTKKNYSICEEECTVSEINKAEELKKLQRK